MEFRLPSSALRITIEACKSINKGAAASSIDGGKQRLRVALGKVAGI